MDTALRDTCEAAKHDTLWAYRKHGCRCPATLKARNQRNADRRVGATKRPTTPRVGLRNHVAALTARGRSVTQIAAHLGVNPRTVERHRQALRNIPTQTQPVAPAAADPDWRDRAACANPNYNPDWWTTPRARPRNVDVAAVVRDVRRALAICDTCPVRQACATDATNPDIPRPVEIIRAGIAYDYEGKIVPNCVRCGHAILCRAADILYCSDTCAGRVRRPQRVRGDRAWQPDTEAAA